MGLRLKIVLVVLGAVMFFAGFQELALRNAASDEPQDMTLAELAEHGPGDNAHVRVSDFLLCTFSFIYEEKYGRWTTVWVPAVPLGGEYHRKLQALVGDNGEIQGELPMPTDIRVIVKDTGGLSQDDVVRLGEQDTVQGLVVNDIESLSSEERRLLEQSYPGVDFRSCWILHEGRKPAGTGKLALLLGFGAALTLAGAALLLQEALGRRRNSDAVTRSATHATQPAEPRALEEEHEKELASQV